MKRDGTLGGAIARFGWPALRRVPSDGICRATWSRLGLVVTFYNLAGEDPCAPRTGHFGRAVVTRPLWRTSKGVRIGDSERRLRAVYPGVRLRLDPAWGAGYWLVPRSTPFAGRYPGLLARVRHGRVVELRVHYQAGGE